MVTLVARAVRRYAARVACVVVACASMLFAATASIAQGVEPQVDARRVAQVKAAYVLNFVRYTEWPAGTPSDRVVITLLGRTSSSRTFQEVFKQAGHIAGRPLVVRRIDYPAAASDGSIDPAAFRHFYDQIAQGHVLFVSRSEKQRLAQVLARVGPGVLTISDIPGFASNGGMIELVLAEDRVVFEANARAIDLGGLRVSSKAMKLARAVHGGALP
jgi:hypothetical protein